MGQVRLVSSVTSADAKPGDPIEGVLSAPLFSPDSRLILPEGTRLTGKVRRVRRARWFRRGGQLRFTFDEIDPPGAASSAHTRRPIMTQVLRAEAATNGNVEIDGEGAAKVTESKKRLLGPMLALAAAVQPQHHAEHPGGRASASYGGRADSPASAYSEQWSREAHAQSEVCWASTGWGGRFMGGLSLAGRRSGSRRTRLWRSFSEHGNRPLRPGASPRKQRAKASIMYTLWGYLIQKRTQR